VVEVTVHFKPVLLTVPLLLCVFLIPLPAWSQQTAPPMPFPSPGRPPFPSAEPSPEDVQQRRMEREMAKAANRQRQEHLKRDTARLLKLATELKREVDQSNANILSVKVIKKAEEIEKLAHSVKEKMKGD
jgi:hypothetical protein